MKDFMIDLETMGLGVDSLITTVSIVQFDLKTGELGEEFEMAIDWENQEAYGAVLDINTVKWWLRQSNEAINTMMRLKPHKVNDVIEALNVYFKNNTTNIDEVSLWGNGKEFDNVLIRNLYKRHGEVFPVPYWCDMDVRTLVKLAGVDTRNFPFDGIKHRGIDDCKHQINYCHHAYRMIKGGAICW